MRKRIGRRCTLSKWFHLQVCLRQGEVDQQAVDVWMVREGGHILNKQELSAEVRLRPWKISIWVPFNKQTKRQGRGMGEEERGF